MSDSSDTIAHPDIERMAADAFGLMQSLPRAIAENDKHAEQAVEAGFKTKPADFVVDERLAFDIERAIDDSGNGTKDLAAVSEIADTTDKDAEHLLLRIRKTRVNTLDIQRMLAQWIGCRRSDVGYSGLKDVQAVTSQWFSVPYRQTYLAVAEVHAGEISLSQIALACQSALEKKLPQPNENSNVTTKTNATSATIDVVDAARYTRKLRLGSHVDNRFTIVLRECKLSVGEPLLDNLNSLSTAHQDDAQGHSAVQMLFEERLQAVKTHGFPNYFGLQRFGRRGSNLATFLDLIRDTKKVAGGGGRRGRLSPRQQMALSAARGFIFNSYCASRVGSDSWLTAETGEPVMLGSGNGFFVNDGVDTTVPERILAGDLSPSGPLVGRADGRDRSSVERVEQECDDLIDGLIARFDDVRRLSCLSQQFFERIGLRHQRRALRAMPRNLDWHWIDRTTLQIEFELPPGVYATALLQQLGLRV